MQIYVGSEIIYRCSQQTPMILMVQVHARGTSSLLII
jgi:hypothetical protein